MYACRLVAPILLGFMNIGNAYAAMDTDILVSTPLGHLVGIQHVAARVNEFKGILYAKAERFGDPISAQAWQGTKDAKKFGDHCPQAARFDLTEESLAEDCLYLNVSAPSDIQPDEKLPVMVWIPGGGFVGGGSNLYRLDRLAHTGRIVVVSINYRMGMFGFMPHPAMNPDSNGNLGLEDQRVALRWVQQNISAFGGNPNNVTIAGESAGSGSICQHLASPEYVSGLFQKALLISGACLQELPTVQQALEQPIWQSVSFNPKDKNRKFRCPITGDSDYSATASLACLKDVPLKDLLEAQTYEAGNSILSFVPTTGGKTIPRSFKDALSSEQIVKVPMIIGGAKNELRLYVAYDVLGDNANNTKYPVTLENVIRYYMPAFYGSDQTMNQKILMRYFGSATQPTGLNGATLGSMFSDFNPHVAINNCLYLRTSNALNSMSFMPPIYQFEFDDPHAPVLGIGIAKGEEPGFPLGAVHSSILNYLFPKFSNTSAMDAPELSNESKKLSTHMIAYITSFMKDGQPSKTGQATWSKYDGTNQYPASNHVMLFSPNIVGLQNSYGGIDAASRIGHQCAFWHTLYPE